MQAQQSPAWSPDNWAAFWSAPDARMARDRIPRVVSEDVVAYWPYDCPPARGVEAYTARVVDMLALAPDLVLTRNEFLVGPDAAMVSWTARGTGPDGPFTGDGVDRIKLRNGRVYENRIFSDMAIFRHLVAAARAG